MRSSNVSFAVALVLVVFGSSLYAQTFVPGDIIVAGSGPGTTPPTFLNWKILWFAASGTLKGVLYDQPQTTAAGSEIAFDGGILYAVVGGQLLRMTPTSTTTVATPGSSPRFLTVAADGGIYFSNVLTPQLVTELNPANQVVGSTNVGDDALSVDLAADQCILFFTSSTPAEIRRFNVCTNTPLGAFSPAQAGVTYGMLRLLPDGALHSHTGPGGVVRRDLSGQIVQTYGGLGFALALDPDRQSFWSVQGSSLVKVNLASGAIVQGPIAVAPTMTSIFAIAVVGEPRAAVTADARGIPTLAPWMLVLLLGAVSVAAVVRLR